MPLSNSNLYVLALSLCAVFFLIQSLRTLPSFPSASTPTPLLLPFPVLFIGTTGVHYLHSLMLRLAPPQLTLYWHAGSFAITGALRAAAKVGVADALEAGPLSLYALAKCTATYGPHLQRLLVALETVGVFRRDEAGRWMNSPISDFLRSRHPASMRAAVQMLGEEQFVAVSRLDHALTTTHAAYPHLHDGRTLYEDLALHPAAAATFSRGQHGLSFLVDQPIVADYHFDEADVICDVAGGLGAFLRQVLTLYPHTRGVLYDLPAVIDLARDEWVHSPLQNRSTLVGGDFFDAGSVPGWADTYVLKQVLHQWGDGEAVGILRNVVAASGGKARVLVVERVMRGGVGAQSFIASHGSAFVDLVMMAVFEGGYERYEADWHRVFVRAGLELRRTVETRSDFAVMECWPIRQVKGSGQGEVRDL